MIWNSVVMMTIFDLIIISFVVFTFYVFLKRKQAIQHFRATLSVFLILFGLGIIALFYLADLFTMLVLPFFIPKMQAMDIMEQLHLNFLWYVMLLGMSFLVFGVNRLVSIVFPDHLSRLEGLKDSHDQMAQLASTDSLTGLINRRTFLDEMGQTLSYPNQTRHKSAFLFIDLDKFKPINDLTGHEAGDSVLVEVAKRLEGNIRRSDMAIRYGGDEFIICLRGIDNINEIKQITENITTSLTVPITVGHQDLSISLSIGISIYPEHGNDITSLIQRADLAMYDVKRSGGNGYKIFNG